MRLKQLSAIQFKNYQQIELSFSERINCFVGKNGVGKTNLLDAIYYLSMTKSYFNAVDKQNIKHGADFFVVQGTFEKNDSDEQLYCGVKLNQKKRFKRNDKDYQRIADHIGQFPVVMVSPNDNILISGGSDERRKYIDSVISQFDREYLNNLIAYNKALTNRNKLLKDFAKSGFYDHEVLDTWDMQMLRYGNPIFEVRKSFVQELIPIIQQFYDFVSDGNEEIKLNYRSQLLDNSFEQLLQENRQKDSILQHSSVGLHKDDISLDMGEYPIRKIGSQGQQKTFLVALKLAQFEFIRKTKNHAPILLLDDIFDKLDTERVRKLVQLVAEQHFGQIFITHTDQTHLEQILADLPIEHQIFNLSETNYEVSDRIYETDQPVD